MRKHFEPRPRWRGVSHAWAFVATFPAGALLIVMADGLAARIAASIYTASLLITFGTSAAYHRIAQSPRARAIMQRYDHSMIYLLIAGTYVPVCVVALPPSWGVPLLIVVGVGAAVGITLRLIAARRLAWIGYALYPALGWAAVFAAPALVDNLSGVQLGLIIAGGLAYTIGFPVLLTRWPDPWPRTFGYHEVWHTFTIVAAVLHFTAVATLIR